MRKTGILMLALAGVIVIARSRSKPLERPNSARETIAVATPVVPSVPPGSRAAEDEAERFPGKATSPEAAAFSRYRDLAAKVFPTEDEKAVSERLLHDAELLEAAGRQVTSLARPTPTLARAQDDALTLLLASARAREPAAARVLATVVRDGAIEDSRLEPATRRRLAGLKAEALFTWSADSPEVVGGLPGLLPGPVSRKIWANVVERQRANAAESTATAASAAEGE